MPRNARRPAPATPPLPATSPGQSYGVAGEQKAAMNVLPLPDAAPIPGGVSGAPPSSGPPPAMQAAAPAPAGDGEVPAGADPTLEQAVMAALLGPAPAEGGLTRPSERPDEPLLAMPPARQLGRVTPTARVLSMLAEANGNDPALRSIADDAAMRGY